MAKRWGKPQNAAPYEERVYEQRKLPRTCFGAGHFPRCGRCRSRLPKVSRGQPDGQRFKCSDCLQRWELRDRKLYMVSQSMLSRETIRILRDGRGGRLN